MKELESLDIFTCKNGKKHGLRAVAIGGKTEPDYFYLYREDVLVESAKTLEDLYTRTKEL